MKNWSRNLPWFALALCAVVLAVASPGSGGIPLAREDASTSIKRDPPRPPHPQDGHADCLGCHGPEGTAPKHAPADHAGRTNNMCPMCHYRPAS